MTNKTVASNFNAIEDSNTLTHNTCSKIFKNFISNLVAYLLIEHSKPLDKYNLKSVIQYSSFASTADFYLIVTTEE